MAKAPEKRRGPVTLGEIVGRIIEPVTARRGMATADLIAVWPEIAGPLHAAYTAPERIVWPRQSDANEPAAGVLFIRAEGPRSIFVQHEIPQIIERVNAFFGYRAIAEARIVQAPVKATRNASESVPPQIGDEAAERIAAKVADVGSDGLRDALARLGRAVYADRRE